MITSWDIYWITRLDAICGALAFISILGAVGLCAAGVIVTVEDLWKDYWRKYMVAVMALMVFMFCGLLTPNTKTAIAIYMVPKIVNNDHVMQLPEKAAKYLNGKFDEWINDMVSAKKKKP